MELVESEHPEPDEPGLDVPEEPELDVPEEPELDVPEEPELDGVGDEELEQAITAVPPRTNRGRASTKRVSIALS